ncbi:hypothetical protein MGWOODY_Tha292 [hydrothermal vent metagenome]|uniref:Uncharacterized protein n=1 Tax=hydrothermal vent metagenome TaxID=652676 RepID=A0A160T9U5_9ZZZZ
MLRTLPKLGYPENQYFPIFVIGKAERIGIAGLVVVCRKWEEQ